MVHFLMALRSCQHEWCSILSSVRGIGWLSCWKIVIHRPIIYIFLQRVLQRNGMKMMMTVNKRKCRRREREKRSKQRRTQINWKNSASLFSWSIFLVRFGVVCIILDPSFHFSMWSNRKMKKKKNQMSTKITLSSIFMHRPLFGVSENTFVERKRCLLNCYAMTFFSLCCSSYEFYLCFYYDTRNTMT